ncbi:MAG: hypothetical protein JXB06_06600 [Spirochaetales bacterium]|nr:hypothetical protein [Spirochaetales bacterium]
MIRRFLLPALFLLCLVSAGAQDGDLERFFQDEDLESLIDKALQLQITAKVLPQDQQPVWNTQSKKITIPGRSVAVRLVGDNIRIDVVFTPYQEESGTLLLVAQGQVWFSEAPDAKTTYLTTIQSIPVSWGEKVLFFPLGFSKELANTQTFNIQLEVEIYPYRDLFRAPVAE